jgi:hypothetical protein
VLPGDLAVARFDPSEALVRSDRLDDAVRALRNAGHRVED